MVAANKAIMFATASCGRTAFPALCASKAAAYGGRYTA